MKNTPDLNSESSAQAIEIPAGYNGISISKFKDELFGALGEENRNRYEAELKEEVLGKIVRRIRKIKKISQGELGSLVEVGKAQISQIEKNYNNVTIANFLRILNTLNVTVKLSIEINDKDKEKIELSY